MLQDIRLALRGFGRDRALGTALGLLTTAALAHFVESLLFGVPGMDPKTFLAAAAFLLAVATLACYVPARRAARTDPMAALRSE